MEICKKGRRQISRDGTKEGVKNFKWVTQACTELGKCKLVFGPNKLVAQQPFSNSSLGLSTISPNAFEPGECSKDSVGPILSTHSFKKVGESPLVPLTSSVVST